MAESMFSIVLCDAGGLAIFLILFGVPFGSIIDFLWNFLVFSVALRLIPGGKEISIGGGRRFFYTLFITLLGVVIDWAYFEITWDMDIGKSATWVPAMSQWLQLVALLLPMAMIWVADAALAWAFLRLEKKQAVILGAAIGFFTAPWLLPIVPYAFNWVI